MFSADPACEIGFVEQLEKRSRGRREEEGRARRNCFTTKTQRTRSFGLGKFLFPELRALCVLVVKLSSLCPSLPLRLVEQLEKDAEGAEREGRTQRKLFYHKDTEDTEFGLRKFFYFRNSVLSVSLW